MLHFASMEETMEQIDRRSVIGLGIVASTAVLPFMATAQTGKQLAPGVKQIDYGERDS